MKIEYKTKQNITHLIWLAKAYLLIEKRKVDWNSDK